MNATSRRHFLKTAAALLAVGASAAACAPAGEGEATGEPQAFALPTVDWKPLPTLPPTPTLRAVELLSGEQALQRLLDGNKRFQAGEAVNPNQGPDRRADVAIGQAPLAIVLTCADSRVSPELVFDQGLGDLYTVRVAGNVLSDSTLASIEYAAERISAPLVLVLGHSGCGAVRAAYSVIELGAAAEGHIGSLVERLRPAIEDVRGETDALVDRAIRANAILQLEQIRRRSPAVQAAQRAGLMRLAAGYYDLESGAVEIIAAS
jgi:carbonic anhydrase